MDIHTSNFDAFRSTVDGSVIKTTKDLKNHNERNNVVNYDEFGADWVKKEQKRQKIEQNREIVESRKDDLAEMARRIEDVTTKWHLDFVSLTTNPNQVYL